MLPIHLVKTPCALFLKMMQNPALWARKMSHVKYVTCYRSKKLYAKNIKSHKIIDTKNIKRPHELNNYGKLMQNPPLLLCKNVRYHIYYMSQMLHIICHKCHMSKNQIAKNITNDPTSLIYLESPC